MAAMIQIGVAGGPEAVRALGEVSAQARKGAADAAAASTRAAREEEKVRKAAAAATVQAAKAAAREQQKAIEDVSRSLNRAIKADEKTALAAAKVRADAEKEIARQVQAGRTASLSKLSSASLEAVRLAEAQAAAEIRASDRSTAAQIRDSGARLAAVNREVARRATAEARGGAGSSLTQQALTAAGGAVLTIGSAVVMGALKIEGEMITARMGAGERANETERAAAQIAFATGAVGRGGAIAGAARTIEGSVAGVTQENVTGALSHATAANLNNDAFLTQTLPELARRSAAGMGDLGGLIERAQQLQATLSLSPEQMLTTLDNLHASAVRAGRGFEEFAAEVPRTIAAAQSTLGTGAAPVATALTELVGNREGGGEMTRGFFAGMRDRGRDAHHGLNALLGHNVMGANGQIVTHGDETQEAAFERIVAEARTRSHGNAGTFAAAFGSASGPGREVANLLFAGGTGLHAALAAGHNGSAQTAAGLAGVEHTQAAVEEVQRQRGNLALNTGPNSALEVERRRQAELDSHHGWGSAIETAGIGQFSIRGLRNIAAGAEQRRSETLAGDIAGASTVHEQNAALASQQATRESLHSFNPFFSIANRATELTAQADARSQAQGVNTGAPVHFSPEQIHELANTNATAIAAVLQRMQITATVDPTAMQHAQTVATTAPGGSPAARNGSR